MAGQERGRGLRFMWETQESPPWLLSILYGVQHHFTLLSLSSFNALIKCSSSNCHFQNTPLLSLHHHNRPCGQETSNPPQSCKNPPHLCLFASLHNPNPINTPSPSLSLHLLLLLLLCFLQPPTEKPPERELLLLLPLITKLHHLHLLFITL